MNVLPWQHIVKRRKTDEMYLRGSGEDVEKA